MVTEGAWWQTMADDAAWQGQWEARRALAEKGAHWRSVADGVAWQGLGWQLTMDVRCERSCRFSAAPCRSQFRTSKQVQDSKEAVVMNASSRLQGAGMIFFRL